MSKQEIQKLTDEYSQHKDTKLIERIACYIRVSTQEQKLHGLSLDAQRDTLKRYAETHGLKIIEWYEDEGVSGRKLIKRRPALQRMLNDAQAGKFDRIIFIKLDRYFRSVAEYHECQKILDSSKVTWTATEEHYDLTTANGRYWINQKISMAEYEADNTGERIKLVNEYKIRTGQPLCGSQSLGVAYTVALDKETGLKKVVPDPETKELVMDYINYFITHQNKRQAYTYVRDKYNSKFSYKALGKVLIDTKIYGHYKGNDFYCVPYIDKELFNMIQDILKNNIKTPSTKRVYLFSGLISCPECHKKMAATFSGKQVTHKKSGKTYVYNNEYVSYRCNHAYLSNDCNYHKRPNELKIEDKLLDNLDHYMTVHITQSNVDDARVKNSEAANIIKELKAEMTRINNMYKKGRLTDAEYDTEYEELEERLKNAESHLEPITERDLKPYEELLKQDWRTLYNSLNRVNKRAFWRKYLKAITLNEDGTINRPIFF